MEIMTQIQSYKENVKVTKLLYDVSSKQATDILFTSITCIQYFGYMSRSPVIVSDCDFTWRSFNNFS